MLVCDDCFHGKCPIHLFRGDILQANEKKKGSKRDAREKTREREGENTRYYFTIITRLKLVVYRWCCSITCGEERESKRRKRWRRRVCVSLTCFVRSALRRPYVHMSIHWTFALYKSGEEKKSSENGKETFTPLEKLGGGSVLLTPPCCLGRFRRTPSISPPGLSHLPVSSRAQQSWPAIERTERPWAEAAREWWVSLNQQVMNPTNLDWFIDLVYSSSSTKANEFLSHEKCVQRMKCPINRKEECSEECQAGRPSGMPMIGWIPWETVSSCPFLGNTEEEVEEHLELFVNERRSAVKRAPKSKSESTASKRRAKKEPPAVEITDETNSSSVEKTELWFFFSFVLCKTKTSSLALLRQYRTEREAVKQQSLEDFSFSPIVMNCRSRSNLFAIHVASSMSTSCRQWCFV